MTQTKKQHRKISYSNRNRWAEHPTTQSSQKRDRLNSRGLQRTCAEGVCVKGQNRDGGAAHTFLLIALHSPTELFLAAEREGLISWAGPMALSQDPC